MGLGDFLGDILQDTVSITSDILTGAATVIGDVADGVTTVASDIVEGAGAGLGAAVGMINESAGDMVKRSGRLVANGVRVPGRTIAGGVKATAGVVAGVSNIVVGNNAKVDEIGLSISETMSDACDSIRESFEAIAVDTNAIIPPLRGPLQMFCMDHVEPVPGSIVCCDLALAVDHSGVYIGDGKIIHRDGDGYLACVDKDTFLGRLDGLNPSVTVFVACKGGEPVGSQEVANRAKRALQNPKHSRGYNLITKNCHQFCQYCLTGKVNNGTFDFTFAHLEAVLKDVLSVDSWRVMDGSWKC